MKSRRSSSSASVIFPSDVFAETMSDLIKRASILFNSMSDAVSGFAPTKRSLRSIFSQFNRRRLPQISWKNHVPKILFGVLIVGILVAAGSVLSTSAKPTGDDRVELKGAIATLPLNKEFSFPLKDGTGKELSQLKYVLESAELRDDIIVKGQRMVAVKGRRFLILTIKITNDYSQALEVNVRDYIRLSVNGNVQELLAADIHSDPVAIQAISTKGTRLGFPINDSEKNLTLLVGEINGEKQNVDLQF